jgi:hypothetical protein
MLRFLKNSMRTLERTQLQEKQRLRLNRRLLPRERANKMWWRLVLERKLTLRNISLTKNPALARWSLA